MAKSLIINNINGKNSFIEVPTTDANATTFAQTFLDGAYAVYESVLQSGSDTVATAPDDVNIMFKNKASGKKGYMSIKTSSSDETIFNALMGLTLNGVLIDEAYVITRKTATRW